MQKDFHYYCVGVLARAAGFSKKDALTIAYASQYVDDSTESEPLHVGDMIFDPVRTAHIGLESYDWAVQKKIYFPFHFLPPKEIRNPGDPYIVQPNSAFGRKLFNELSNVENELLRLCRIGVALHTFADTWSHRLFSGRHHEENDVEKIYEFRKGKWKYLTLKNIYLDFLPQIGHTEADYFPDIPFLTWKYTRMLTGRVIKRNNTDMFLRASRSIYDLLCNLSKADSRSQMPWEDIKGDIRKLLATRQEDVEKRCDKWRDCFQHLFEPHRFEYDSRKWRNDALNPQDESDTNWDGFKRSEFEKLHFPMKPGFYDSPWVQFHRAALLQRHFALENLL